MPSCRTMQPQNGIIKKFRQKDADRVWHVKKPLKSVKMESLKVDNSIFINDSLCNYYKHLWSKCKRLWTNSIYTLFECQTVSWKQKGKLQTQYHNQSYHGLKKFFPDTELFKNEESEPNQQLFVLVVLFRYVYAW